MKFAFAAGALTLMTTAGISSTPAAAQWRGATPMLAMATARLT